MFNELLRHFNPVNRSSGNEVLLQTDTETDQGKIISDLRDGFRVSTFRITHDHIEVITRNKLGDLFIVSARYYIDYYNVASLTIEVGRWTRFPAFGACSVDSWRIRKYRSTRKPDELVYEGNVLGEGEFWRRYNGSTVDTSKTKKLLDDRRKNSMKITPTEDLDEFSWV